MSAFATIHGPKPVTWVQQVNSQEFRPADFEPQLKTRLLVLQPTPFCNIRCTYCYLPDRDDKSRMSLAVARRAIQRIAEDGLLADKLTVIWHAGEPLAMPRDFYEEAMIAINQLAGPQCQVTHAMQTNAMLIDDNWCNLFQRHSVHIGVSIDGPAFLHDAHRVTRRGHGTHARVQRGIERLRVNSIPFQAIAVVTAQTFPHADAFADYFESLGATEVGCNFDEAEGGHQHSSVEGHEASHLAFLRKLFERADSSNGRLRIREQHQSLRRLSSKTSQVSWRGIASPDNIQVQPFAIINVACNGDFGTFSPELLGFTSAKHESFTLGNVMQSGFLESAQREPFTQLWAAIQRGTHACRQTCAYFDFCGGGAPVNKLTENGDLSTAETLYCRSMIQRPIDVFLSQAETSSSTFSAMTEQPS